MPSGDLIDVPRYREAIAERLNLLEEVRWDRFTSLPGADEVTVYGWIDRPDGRADFVLIIFGLDVLEREGPIQWEQWFTSSAERSVSIYERLTGRSAEGHVPCQRVDETFGGLVAKTTEGGSRAPTPQQLALAFRAFVADVCEEVADVEPTLKRYQLPDGLAEEVQALLEAAPAPVEVEGG